MARKVILQDSNNVHILPITRGELVVDSSGNQALHSQEFLATTSRPGLMSAEDKRKLDTGAGVSVDSELSNSSTNPVQNKVLTQIINSIRKSYLKSASVENNKLTITDQNDNEIEFVRPVTQMFIGAKDTTTNTVTTSGNTYLKLFEGPILKNQYNIKGAGFTAVTSDANGNITINTPNVSWDSILGIPDTFEPSVHEHNTLAGISADNFFAKRVPIVNNGTLGQDANSSDVGMGIYFCYGNRAQNSNNITGTLLSFRNENYGMQIIGDYSKGTNISYRTRNGDNSSWNSWYNFITSANISTQSVGSANTLTTARSLWGQSFDGSADISGNLSGVGNVYPTSSSTFDLGSSTNEFRNAYLSGAYFGMAENGIYISKYGIGCKDSSNNHKSYALHINSEKGNVGIGTEATNADRVTVSGSLRATTLIGNLDGQFVNALTGYDNTTSASQKIVESDSLYQALYKIEYNANLGKTAYDWYQAVTGVDDDEYINKWNEIVDFVDSVKEGTDILDELVTRKTPQIIIGQKTFSEPVFVQNTYNNNKSYGVRLLGFEDSGYLQLGQISGDGASHKGIISGINGVKMGSLTLNSTITSISGGLTVAGQASFNSVLTALSGVQTTMIYTPGSDSNTYSGGANGQVLKSNGSTIYWATDLNTTYTFENGTNCFYVTPLGGDKQTVTVTPSIANNITGSGTSGYIAKWDGTNTITSGPAFGISTTTFLRNDGNWSAPKDPTVLQTAVSNNYAYPLLLATNGQTTNTTTGTYFDSGVTLNPYTNTITANITGSAATLGTSTIGGSSKPIYLNKGVPTECSDYGSTIVDISSSDNINFTVTYLNGNTTSFAIAASTAGATNSTAKLYLIGSNTQAADVLSYSNGNVYMQNGTLYLIRTTAASASANNKPALIVGGSDTAAHLEIDANSIIAKNNGTTAGVLTLQDGLTTAANLKLGNLTIGSGDIPMYVSAGVLTASTSNVGSNKKPIYMSSGKLTPFSSSIGSGTNPIYVNSSGELTASTSTIASGKKLMYLSSGVLTASTESVSAGNKLMYLNSGVLTESTSSEGSATKGVYLNSGKLSQMTYSLNATVNSGTTNYLAYYSGANAISKLTISSSTDTLYILGIKSSGHIPYSATQSSYGVRIMSGSSVYAYGGFYESSDEKLKTILNPIKVDLEDLTKLRKVYFLWKNQSDKKLQIGTIAQDVQKLFPELVGTDDSDYLSVAYDKLSIVALAAIDELYNMVKNLQNENEELKRKLIR